MWYTGFPKDVDMVEKVDLFPKNSANRPYSRKTISRDFRFFPVGTTCDIKDA